MLKLLLLGAKYPATFLICKVAVACLLVDESFHRRTLKALEPQKMELDRRLEM